MRQQYTLYIFYNGHICIFSIYPLKTDPIKRLLINGVIIRRLVIINIVHRHKPKTSDTCITLKYICRLI